MKTYKNISGYDQLGIEPGQTGEREIPEAQEARMVERGAIEVVDAPKVAEAGEASTDTPEKTPEEIEAERVAAEEAEKAERERAEAEKAASQRGGRGGRS